MAESTLPRMETQQLRWVPDQDFVGARPFGARSPVGPPSSTDAAPNIRVPDTIAERTSRMGKPPETEPACRPEIRAELAAAGCSGETANFPRILTLRRTRRVWGVIGVRLTARHLTWRYCPRPSQTGSFWHAVRSRGRVGVGALVPVNRDRNAMCAQMLNDKSN